MNMGTKQKTLLVVSLLVLGYIGYEVYGFIKGDVIGVSKGNLPKVTALKPVSISPQQAQVKATAQQKAYLKMVNQYELVKMQRRLLEERAAIAAAQHRIAALNQQTRDIAIEMNAMMDHPQPKHFQLTYVDRQSGRWSATLNQGGRYYHVHVGSMLVDGSTIKNINRRGVLLEKGDSREHITFNGVSIMRNPPAVKKPEIKKHTASANLENIPVENAMHRRMISETIKAVKKKERDIVVAKHHSAPRYTDEEQRILDLPKNTYTIQLIGSYHKAVVAQFARAHNLGDHAMPFHVTTRGKRWYMLIYGNYATLEDAQKALHTLRPDLMVETPWIRAVKNIQASIRRTPALAMR